MREPEGSLFLFFLQEIYKLFRIFTMDVIE